MRVHTCDGAVPRLDFALALPPGSTAQLLPSQHEPVLCQCYSSPASHPVPQFQLHHGSSSASPPVFASTAQPSPAQPRSIPISQHAPRSAPRSPPQYCPPCPLARSNASCFCGTLLLVGETFQYARMEPLGNWTADTEVITTKHKWTAIFHRRTVLLNMSRFQRND